MEIEAKYTAPRIAFVKLMEFDALGDYRLETLGEYRVIDHYMDTADRDILKGGYACRMREKDEQCLLTVKGLGGAEGAIHQREEYEMEVHPGTSPHQWPDDTARDLLFLLTQSRPLVELFVIRQSRTERKVLRDNRFVGEMSLDVVDMESVGQEERIYEIEIELKADGTLEDLQVLDEILQSNGLRPETLSKFERAIAQLVD